jgi:hypothetical protein
MSIPLSPDRADAVSAAIRDVARKAHDATLPNDLDSARKALGLVYWALHAAVEAINKAERETRREALNNIGEAA